MYGNQFEGSFERNLSNLGGQLLIEVAVSGMSKPQTTRDRVQADFDIADKKLKTGPDDLDARLARAIAYFRLGDNQKALDDFEVVIAKNPGSVPAKAYKVIVLGRLGKKADALSEMEKFQKGDAPECSAVCLAAVLKAELGEGANKAFETLEAAIQKQPKNAEPALRGRPSLFPGIKSHFPHEQGDESPA